MIVSEQTASSQNYTMEEVVVKVGLSLVRFIQVLTQEQVIVGESINLEDWLYYQLIFNSVTTNRAYTEFSSLVQVT